MAQVCTGLQIKKIKIFYSERGRSLSRAGVNMTRKKAKAFVKSAVGKGAMAAAATASAKATAALAKRKRPRIDSDDELETAKKINHDTFLLACWVPHPSTLGRPFSILGITSIFLHSVSQDIARWFGNPSSSQKHVLF